MNTDRAIDKSSGSTIYRNNTNNSTTSDDGNSYKVRKLFSSLFATHELLMNNGHPTFQFNIHVFRACQEYLAQNRFSVDFSCVLCILSGKTKLLYSSDQKCFVFFSFLSISLPLSLSLLIWSVPISIR